MKELKRLEKTYYYKVLRALVCVCACAMYILGLSGCNPDEPMQEVTLPVSICLPVGEVYASQAPTQRVFGDPGTTEQFALPTHIYIYIVKGDKVWEIIEKTPSSSDWIKTHYEGQYETDGDSIYVYTPDNLNLLLEGGSFTGRVYIVASAVALAFNETIKKDGSTSLSDLLDLSFSFDTSTGTDEQKAAAALVRENLQNIYSTPYNYEVGTPAHYYGSFYATQKVPHLNLLLYHVAAKVDLMWNVADSMRIKPKPSEAVRLTYLGVQHLFDGQAYCFKPMRNELATINSAGYAITDIVTKSDEGLWWEGRDYFYTIPYTVTDTPDYFPLQMLMRTNGSEGAGYQLTLNMQIDTSAVFVPWLRANFNLTQPLTDKTDTITVDL